MRFEDRLRTKYKKEAEENLDLLLFPTPLHH
jgi:hypothetical protein